MTQTPTAPTEAACSGTRWGLRLRYAVAGFASFLAYRVLGLRRAVIRRNLARSFPSMDDAARRRVHREFTRRQGEILAELEDARHITADELRQRVRLVDPRGVLEATRSSTKPLVLVAGHQCNFEWLLLRVSLELGEGLVGLYKPLRNRRAERYFRAVRTRFGSRLLPAKDVTREIGRVRSAKALGLIADQVPKSSPERHWTQFLHQDTAFFKGPERLARLLRAQVVYLSMRRLARGRYEVELVPLTAPGERTRDGEITERYARALERDIEGDSAGWWWAHRRWKLARPAVARAD